VSVTNFQQKPKRIILSKSRIWRCGYIIQWVFWSRKSWRENGIYKNILHFCRCRWKPL